MADIPKIRFKGFTEPWEQRKLGEICSRVQGNDGRMELPTLTISAANGWMKQEDRFSGNIAGKEQKNYTLLHKGELSYNHGNSKLAKYGTVFSLQTYEEALVPRVYHSFKVEIGSADFIEYYFATKMPDRELRKLISSGARMDGLLNIGYDDFMGIKMMFPSVLEQDKIAEYFRAFDHLITLHQRKYFIIYNKLITWEQRKVSEYANFFTGNGLNWNDISDDGEQECILYGNLYTDYGMITENIVYRTNTEIKNPVYSEYGDVLIPASDTTSTGLARATSLEKSGVLLGGDINIIRPNEGINGSCLSLALNANRKELIRLIKGTTVRHIHNSEIKDIVICLPKLETEQVRVSSYFKQLDHLITLHRRAL